MSSQAPPTLLELVWQKLLREEALVICALEHLPEELFPPLFKAFTGWCWKVLSDLCLGFQLDEYETKLLQRIQRRRNSLQLCCQKIKIWGLPIHRCQSLSQLKRLKLRGNEIINLCPVPLQVLLDRVSGTLQTLELVDWRLGYSELSALLPALSSHLTTINFYENDTSMTVLKDLFHHTSNLSQWTLELDPAPLKCYDDVGLIPEIFFNIVFSSGIQSGP
ncbi:PRAME family member 3-like [Nannospalax galili]|uniref:PRAME family member 3-like n=1 Tax=Nannospalax galili TaxID=1026970 RepID=UPI00111BFF15|nr:PRAME family member 3-like [Nannospalax galili]